MPKTALELEDPSEEAIEAFIAAGDAGLLGNSDEGLQSDAGELPAEEEEVETPAEEPPAQDATDSAETEPTKEEQKPEAKEEPKKEPTRYEKAQARAAEEWKKVQAEKEALAAEKEALRKEKETLEQSKRASGEYRDNGGFTAEDYEAAAVAYREEGNEEMAQVAQQRAQQTRQAAENARIEATRNAFQAQIDQEIAARPELKDPNTPLGKATIEILKENQALMHRPDGFRRAVALAEAQIKAGSVPALQEENTRLKQQVEELNKKLSIGPSGPTKRASGSVDPANMSDAEMERFIARLGDAPIGG